jgi:hypothetical protein
VDTSLKSLSPGTTAGDVDYYTSSTAKARLGIGTTGQVLTVAGGVPSWATPASGGMTLISTTTLTGASVTLSSIAASYNSLRLVVRDYLPATDSTKLAIRFNADSGSNYAVQRSSSTATSQTFASTQAGITEVADNAVANSLAVIDVPDYANTDTWKMAICYSIMIDPTTTTSVRMGIVTATYNQTPALSSVTLLPETGNFTSGTVLLYGVK